MNQPGNFVISLDFELYWGTYGSLKGKYEKNIEGVQQIVPAMLDYFQQYGIRATWATVGMLFAENKDEALRFSPTSQKPTYSDKKFDGYEIFKENKNLELFFDLNGLLNTVKKTPGQEIQSHTYSHYFCLEAGQNRQQFEEDIKSAVHIANQKGLTLNSVVFPMNQIREDYLSVLKKYGIHIYRGNPKPYFYKANAAKNFNRLDKKILRLLDCYLNISGSNTISLEKLTFKNELLCIPGSSFFRPYSSRLSFVEPLKILRIKRAMLRAAKRGEIYHLWWHPHNFGANKEENLKALHQILDYFSFLKKEYKMCSSNMSDIYEMFKESKA